MIATKKDVPETPSWKGVYTRRNRFAIWLANLVLRLLASPDTRKFISGSMQYGMDAACRDVEEGVDPPPSWRTYLP